MRIKKGDKVLKRFFIIELTVYVILIMTSISILTMAGCSNNINQEEQEKLTVQDKKPVEYISETHYTCRETDCSVNAVAIFLKCYGIQIYPSAIAADRDIFDVLKDNVDYYFLWQWEDVEAKIAEGAPVLLKLYHEPQFMSEEKITEYVYLDSHWVVAYDIREDTVYMSDPMYGYTTSPVETLRQSWVNCGKFAIAV